MMQDIESYTVNPKARGFWGICSGFGAVALGG